MTTDLVAYLSFDGECEAAFKHYEKVLGVFESLEARALGIVLSRGGHP
jgi:uncharacterized glyoxalase superfamily protein PhnB